MKKLTNQGIVEDVRGVRRRRGDPLSGVAIKKTLIVSFLVFIGMGWAASLQAQIKPIPDPSINDETSDLDRSSKIGVKALKAVMRLALKREQRRVFNKNPKRIEALQVLLEDDELLEIWISEKGQSGGAFSRSLGTTTLEFGDGALLEKWLAFLGSEGFKDFMETLIPAIEKLIDIISKLL